MEKRDYVPYPHGPSPPYQQQYGVQPGRGGSGYAQYSGQGQPVIVNPPHSYEASHGQVQVVTVPQPYVNDYLPYSIFVCLCCCWCIGIVAIVKSCRVREERDNGNIEEARKLSKEALKYANIALGVGIVLTILYVVLAVLRNTILYSTYY